MAKFIIAICKDPLATERLTQRVEGALKRIRPANLPEAKTSVICKDDMVLGMLHPESIEVGEHHLLAGMCYAAEGASDYRCPGAVHPDGSYALFRFNNTSLEILTDPAGSRSIWYYKDEQVFLASSSQRMLIATLGKFERNTAAIPWMLSTGTLGLQPSWSVAIQKLPSHTIAILDRANWSWSATTHTASFAPGSKNADECKKELNATLSAVFQKIPLPDSGWVLPLSGGYDSRAIATLLVKEQPAQALRIPAITWGLQQSLNQPGNDAYIATRLATAFQLQHRYFETDAAGGQLTNILQLFFECSEGTIDHLSGYMDGMYIWKTLYQSGIVGIIRGDEGFGWHPASTAFDVRRSLGLTLMSDYSNLRSYQTYFPSQQIDTVYQRKKKETLAAWRDRLYHQFRIPVFLASLNDIKLSFVEVINPLLSRELLQCARSMPDEYRTGKSLFKQWVREHGPHLPIAQHSATATVSGILSAPEVVSLLVQALSSPAAANVFPPALLKQVLQQIRNKHPKVLGVRKSLFQSLYRKVGKQIRNHLRWSVFTRTSLDPYVLAFRMYLCLYVFQLFAEDASAVNTDA